MHCENLKSNKYPLSIQKFSDTWIKEEKTKAEYLTIEEIKECTEGRKFSVKGE